MPADRRDSAAGDPVEGRAGAGWDDKVGGLGGCQVKARPVDCRPVAGLVDGGGGTADRDGCTAAGNRPTKGAARSLVPAALAKTISAAEAEAIKTRRNRSADRALELFRFRIVRVLVIWLSVGLGLRL